MFKDGNNRHSIILSEEEEKKLDELQKILKKTYKSEVIRACINQTYYDYEIAGKLEESSGRS
jgi:hypothetical protein